MHFPPLPWLVNSYPEYKKLWILMNPYGPESQKLLCRRIRAAYSRLPLSARHQKAQEMTTSESREAWPVEKWWEFFGHNLLGGTSQDSDMWLITMASKSHSRVLGPLPNGLNDVYMGVKYHLLITGMILQSIEYSIWVIVPYRWVIVPYLGKQ